MAVKLRLTPKQDFMIRELADIDDMFYGGQAGGGKSEGLLMFSLYRRLTCPGSTGLMLRRTFPELEKSLIRKSHRYFTGLAKYNSDQKVWRFPNGSMIEFGYCAAEKDVHQYQSAEYDDICFDEAGHFSPFQLRYMRSRLRPAGENRYKTLLRLAGNPGNIGHQYLKNNYVDVARNQVYTTVYEDLNISKTRYFLPAALKDNTLMSARERAEYQAWLRELPEYERKMLEEGDWDYIPGAIFQELRRDIHGIDPQNPPDRLSDFFDFEQMKPKPGIPVFRTGDWGYAKPFAYYWAFPDYEGRIYVFKEMYGCKKGDTETEQNVGIKLISRDQAKRIKEYENEKDIKARLAICDASIWDKPQSQDSKAEKLPSDAEIMEEEGVYWDKTLSKRVKRSRLQGVQQFHDRLRVDDDGLPGIFFFNTCTEFWRTVPVLQPDPLDPDVYDTELEDHAADAIRYLCSARPYKAVKPKPADKVLSHAWLMKQGYLKELN